MLCSSCSEIVMPVAAFDIDGTMGNYHDHFLDFADSYLGVNPVDRWSYDGSSSFSQWFMFMYQQDYRTWHDIKLAYRQGAMKRFMPEFGAMCDVARCADEMGMEVWVTTTRPYLRMDNIDPDTREWLRRNRIPFSGLIYSENKYADLAERIDAGRVVSVFEDQVDMYDQAIATFGCVAPFLVKTQWNRATSRKNQGAAPQAIRHLSNTLYTWRSVHETASAR